MYLLQAWQAVCVVVKFAVPDAFPVSRVDPMWCGHATVQRAVANQSEALQGNHGVLTGRPGGRHRGETQVRHLL